jgi:putative nucleotidyltransferase with HDIG domain
MSRLISLFRKKKATSAFTKGSEKGDQEKGGTLGRWIQNHGVRILLIIVLAMTIRLLFPLAIAPELPEFELGNVATRDVVAPFSYNVYKSPTVLSAEKMEKAGTIYPVLEFIPDVIDSTKERIDRFFTVLHERIDSLHLGEERGGETASEELVSEKEELIRWLGERKIDLDEEGILYLIDPERRELLSHRLIEYISAHLEKGVLTDDSREQIDKELVTVDSAGEEKLLRVDRFLTQSQSFTLAWDEVIDPDFPVFSQSIFLDLITLFLKPNVVYNELETQRRIVLAEAEVSPIKGHVLEGEKIIEQGYRISEKALENYQTLREEIIAREPSSTTYNTFISFIGTFLVNAFLLLIFGLYLYFYRRKLYNSFSSLLSFALIFLIVMFSAAMIARLPDVPTILIPISLASLLIAILHDVRIAVVAILVISILLGGQESFGYDVLFVSLLGGISGGLSIRIVRKRRQLGESILFIAGGYILATVTINMIRLTPWIETIETCGWGGINAVISTLVAMALLPVFEYIFNETTDLSLMELSDFNHPLLKSLVIRAPGTWAHTLAVSSLAEAAAEGIKANSLLARVGCYYHDVGKIKKPEYFIENQSSGDNPHDNCSPKMSAMIIENHVKEGIELAREAKLPQCIIDFIPEHHGTTKISFFYEKAKGKNDDVSVNVHDYSYQGPKPRSKETAICMFADSVESMSRILVDPSPSRIRGMVRTAIKNKTEADQLEECDLTFKDLHLIEDAFVKILLARFHSRIEYLKEESTEGTDDSQVPIAYGTRKRSTVDNSIEGE